MADPFGLSVNVATIVDLLVKVGVQCSVYCSDVKKAPAEVRHILREADRFGALVKDVERLLEGPNGADIDASHVIRSSLEDSRLQFHELAALLEQGTSWNGLLWPFKKNQVAEIIKRLEQCRATVSSGLQVYQTTAMGDVHRDFVLSKLPTAERAGFDAHTDADYAMCLPGTRTEVLESIMTWGAARDSQNIFWLNGMAGTGKSTICRTIAQAFSRKGMLGASFFFKRGEGDRGRSSVFFPTLAAQLVNQVPKLAPYVREEIEQDRFLYQQALKVQLDKFIVKPIGRLSQHVHLSTIVIVVDALDECDDLSHIRWIIELLSQAKQAESVWLKFFVTSRPELPIQLGFKNISGKYEDLILHEIPDRIIEHDITLFLFSQLAMIRNDYNKFVGSERQLSAHWPGSEKVKKLVDMAMPLFIFAATACRFIQDRNLGGPEDQLTHVLEQRGTQESNLDATYLPVLDRLFKDQPASMKDKLAARFKTIVGSIVMLANPLSTSSLSNLIDIPMSTIEDHLDLFHSVLRVPPDRNSEIRPFHLSFGEFLFDINKKGKYPFWIDACRMHEELAKHCLEFLSKEGILRKDMCDLQHPGIHRTDVSKKLIDTCLSPEVQYACRYWAYHWKESKCLIRDGDIVHRFLACHVLHWLEALGLMGRALESPELVKDLVELQDPNCSDEVATLIYDVRNILHFNDDIINDYPLQAYASAIVFAPEQSIVRQTFKSEFLAWLPIPPAVNAKWITPHLGANVLSVAISNERELIVSGSNDGMVRVWSSATGACIQELPGHQDKVWSVVFSTDSLFVASASNDHTVRIWSANTFACTHTLEGHKDRVISAGFSPELPIIASASADQTAKIWHRDTGACIQTLVGHTGRVLSVAFSSDSTLIATGSSGDDKSIRIWCWKTGTCIQRLEGHGSGKHAVAFSSDSMLIAAVASPDIWIWSRDTGTCIRKLHDYSNSDSLSFSEDGKYLLTDRGLVILDDEDPPALIRIGDAYPIHGFSISYHDVWITWNGHKVLFIPSKWRRCSSQISDSIVVIGSDEGNVSILGFSPEHFGRGILEAGVKIETRPGNMSWTGVWDPYGLSIS